jgi:hypothetical protein
VFDEILSASHGEVRGPEQSLETSGDQHLQGESEGRSTMVHSTAKRTETTIEQAQEQWP